MTTDARAQQPVGALLREWRRRRRLSQLELALQADVSTRHLSFVETGRSQPTRAMILRLAEQLEVPLRERNQLLLAGGYAPSYAQQGLDSPELDDLRAALRQVLAAHLPSPALLLDRWWDVLETNESVAVFLEGCSPALLEPPINVCRLSLHPDGMAPRIRNLSQWRDHLVGQVTRRAQRTADDRLAALAEELAAYPGGAHEPAPSARAVVPLELTHGSEHLSFFSLAAKVDTACDVTVEEMTLETFLPADASTSRWLSRRGSGSLGRSGRVGTQQVDR